MTATDCRIRVTKPTYSCLASRNQSVTRPTLIYLTSTNQSFFALTYCIDCDIPVLPGANPDGGSVGCNPVFSNRCGSIISYNFIRKEKISNAINNCYQVNPLFQKFLDLGLTPHYYCTILALLWHCKNCISACAAP